MRWLVTGARGMLGSELVTHLRQAGHEVTAAGRAELDVRDPRAVRTAVRGHDVVVNCAAWTAVDEAEAHEGVARELNALAVGHLAAAAAEHDANFVQVSTDYVFDGTSHRPYPEHAPTSPRSAYGRTKAEGEELARALAPRCIVLRTAWLYGAHGRCFPRTIARHARDRGSVSVVADQVGQPTWTRDVADLVLRLLEAGVTTGTFHATSAGQASWFEFARAVVASAGLAPGLVVPVTTAEHPRAAPRPAWSVLEHRALEKVGVTPIGHWLERWRVAADEVLTSG